MSSMLSSINTTRVFLAGLALLLLLVVQQLVQMPGTSMVMMAMKNSLHTAWFFVVTLLIWYLLERLTGLRGRQARFLCLLCCLPLAALTELLQFFTERDASLGDLVRNLLGSVSALALVQAWFSWKAGRAGRSSLLAGLSLALFLAGFHQVWFSLWYYHERNSQSPQLVDFASIAYPVRPQIRGCWELQPPPADWPLHTGMSVARVCLPPTRAWPGVTLREPLPDWDGWQWLVLEAYLGDAEPLPLTVRVETERDRGMDSAVEVELQPGENRVRIPIPDLIPGEGSLPLVRNLLIFTSNLHAGREFYLAAVGLE